MLSAAERSRLVDENLQYVRALAAQIKQGLPPEIEFEELVSLGTQGLCEAAQRFDPAAGASFATFSYYRIRGAIYDGLRRMGWLPRAEYARIRAESRANALLQAAGATPPTGKKQSLEDELGSLADVLANVATVFVTALSAADEQRLKDGGPAPDERVAAVENARLVRDAMTVLPAKERRLVELHYFGDKTLEQAGRELGLSKSWASRLHARAVDLLRAEIERLSCEREAPARNQRRR
jgi:RNA polymerase sigma factor for flagellar operon FliA